MSARGMELQCNEANCLVGAAAFLIWAATRQGFTLDAGRHNAFVSNSASERGRPPNQCP